VLYGRTESDTVDDAVSVFVCVRPRLFGIAYRMLGSAFEAEDIVQDIWLKWQTIDRSKVRDAPAYLATATMRHAINVLQSARVRREAYVGTWLPEPVDTSGDPVLGAERGEALDFAVLVLLEKLTPKERAAYVLREAFDYTYREIADVIRLSEENSRQLVTRARKHIADGRHEPASRDEHRRLLQTFVAAMQSGDLAGLERLLASDVVSYADGGGYVRAAQTPVAGRARVAEYLELAAAFFFTGVTVTWLEVNGRPAVLLSRDGTIVALMTIDASAEGVDRIMWIVRPSKLAAISKSQQESRGRDSPASASG
jgi:RNA polymerase sigma-70 factor (ECF subfamily)